VHTDAEIEWEPLVIVPNVSAEKAIGNNLIQLRPSADFAYMEKIPAYREFALFLSRFKDEFGVGQEVSVIACSKDFLSRYNDLEAVLAFRNILSFATISKSRATQIVSSYGPNKVSWSDYFSIYPWMMDKGMEYLTTQTPALTGLHQVSNFHGTTSPGLAAAKLSYSFLDHVLLKVMLDRWHQTFIERHRNWDNTCTFRALHVAFGASSQPEVGFVSQFDVGRLIGSWVSAFECLVHPGSGGKSGFSRVVEYLENYEAEERRYFDRRFKIRIGRNVRRVSILSKMYERLYKLRNDYLHGNPIHPRDLERGPIERPVWHVAPILFRYALLSKMKITPKRVLEKYSDQETELSAKRISEAIEWLGEYNLQESAINTLRVGRPTRTHPTA